MHGHTGVRQLRRPLRFPMLLFSKLLRCRCAWAGQPEYPRLLSGRFAYAVSLDFVPSKLAGVYLLEIPFVCEAAALNR